MSRSHTPHFPRPTLPFPVSRPTPASSPDSASSPSWTNFTNSTAGDSFHSLVLKTFFTPPRASAVAGPVPPRHPDANPLRLGLIEISDLPNETEAKTLFDRYFSYTHRFHPVIHEKSLREGYGAFLRSPDTYTGSWKGTSVLTEAALYFAAFSLGSRAVSHGPVTGRERNFVAKAKLLQEYRRPLNKISDTVILLRGLHAQSIEDPGECWHLAGCAVRTAYGMGLHRNLVHLGDDPIEQEQRKRSCGLYQVLSDVPSALNNNISTFAFLHEQQSATGPSATSLITTLEDRWKAWESTVPPHLRVSPEHTWVKPEAIVLGLRAHSIRLLIHRPLLHNAINKNLRTENAEVQQATGRSLAVVVETSIRTAYILAASEGEDVLSAPWYRLFFALNSFMSLAAVATLDSALWSTYTTSDVSKSAIEQALQTVRTFISTLADSGSMSAVRSLPIVDRILAAPAMSQARTPGPELSHDPTPPSEQGSTELPAIDWDLLLPAVQTGSLFGFLGPDYEAQRDDMSPMEMMAWAGSL
ncbi:hypothetical protein MNV49_006446 [Pseudohyphozyma bogoriensis]|nr:hypothetical protein MNV49_006446 [Pseudohyphozyma bogoriensis]